MREGNKLQRNSGCILEMLETLIGGAVLILALLLWSPFSPWSSPRPHPTPVPPPSLPSQSPPIVPASPPARLPPAPPPVVVTAPSSGGCPDGCEIPPSDCFIKGNISKKHEKIYHLPGQRYYDKTIISPDKGERWFCTESEAVDNGWRKAKV